MLCNAILTNRYIGMDTLFVFQIMFISLLFVSILMILKASGVVGGPFVWYSLMIVFIIVVIIIINRSMYTTNRRDDVYWNRRNFDGKYGKIQVPLCANVVEASKIAVNIAGQAGELARQGIENIY